MESFAAESRGFECTKWPKKSKNQPYFDNFGCRWLGVSPERPGRYNNNNNNLNVTQEMARKYKNIKKDIAFWRL